MAILFTMRHEGAADEGGMPFRNDYKHSWMNQAYLLLASYPVNKSGLPEMPLEECRDLLADKQNIKGFTPLKYAEDKWAVTMVLETYVKEVAGPYGMHQFTFQDLTAKKEFRKAVEVGGVL